MCRATLHLVVVTTALCYLSQFISYCPRHQNISDPYFPSMYQKAMHVFSDAWGSGTWFTMRLGFLNHRHNDAQRFEGIIVVKSEAFFLWQTSWLFCVAFGGSDQRLHSHSTGEPFTWNCYWMTITRAEYCRQGFHSNRNQLMLHIHLRLELCVSDCRRHLLNYTATLLRLYIDHVGARMLLTSDINIYIYIF